MPISRQFKIIFVHIPRVAGTSVEKYLGMGSIDQLFSFDKIKLTKWSKKFPENSPEQSKTPQHLTALELKKVIPENIFNSFYKFSIVRNPFDRVISEYLHIKDTSQPPYLARFKTMSLDDFVLEGLSLSQTERINLFDGHLETQCSYVLDENKSLLVDKVFKLENLQECVDFLKNIVGIEAFPHARNTTPIENFTFSEESKEMIKIFYKEDFDFFSYTY